MPYLGKKVKSEVLRAPLKQIRSVVLTQSQLMVVERVNVLCAGETNECQLSHG